MTLAVPRDKRRPVPLQQRYGSGLKWFGSEDSLLRLVIVGTVGAGSLPKTSFADLFVVLKNFQLGTTIPYPIIAYDV